MRIFWKASVLACLFGLWAVAHARAEDAPKPDKSSYSLFNPTPDSELRELSADRPVKSILPITVDAGHVQVEADLANYGFGT